MKAFMYNAAFLCECCGLKVREALAAAGKAPANPDDEHTYDSDDFPKGPFDNGGGEADSFHYCDNQECGKFLHNPLTSDGVTSVMESLRDYVEDEGSGNFAVLDEWADEVGSLDLEEADEFALTAYRKVRALEEKLGESQHPRNQDVT